MTNLSLQHVIYWIFIAMISVFLTACAETTYTRFNEDSEALSFSTRTVSVEISPDFYNNFPNCTLILPSEAKIELAPIKELVEASLARFFTKKITRVIDGPTRNIHARRNSIDLTLPSDQKELAELLNCDAVVRTRIVNAGKTYLMVWSQVQIALEVIMIRVRDNKLLWRASHVADRSRGGIPLSPLGIVMDTFTSTNFSMDVEVMESVIDDAARRITRSLPNARIL